MIGLIALVTVIALVAWLVVRGLGGGDAAQEDTNTSTPTVSAWDETSSPTATPNPTDPDNGGKPVSCPDHYGASRPDPGPRAGRYHGGGLSYAEVPGWTPSAGWGVDWAYDRDGQRNSVNPRWVALTLVGQIDREHFPSPQVAAGQLISCLASSYYYRDITGRQDTSSQAVTIDGRSGWKLVSEIRVKDHDVEGDVIQVIVLDIGREGQFSIFVSEAPIGDQDRIAKTEAAAASLRVEG